LRSGRLFVDLRHRHIQNPWTSIIAEKSRHLYDSG